MQPDPRAIPWRFRQQALASPAAVALVHGEARFSYAQLDELSGTLATELHQRSVRPGEVVALHMARSPEMVVAMLKGIAAFIRQFAGTFDRMIEMLENSVRCLDTSCPEWRESCAAQN